MKRIIPFFFVVIGSQAQFISSPPNRDGSISTGEYGDHTNGRNAWSDGTRTWYMTWDNTNLYLAVNSNGNATDDEFVIYIDTDPQTPVNGGSNSNGSLAGINFDGVEYTRLPFRANFLAYIRNGYHQHRTHNGSGGWNSNVDNSTDIVKTTSGNLQEIAINWSLMGGRPSSFNFIIYLNGGTAYGGTSITGASADGGTASDLTGRQYFSIESTGDGSSTPPFSRLCYVNQIASNNISAYGSSFFGVTVADNQTTTLNTNLTIESFLRVEGGCTWTVSGDRTVTFTGSTATLFNSGFMNANPSFGNTANYDIGNGTDATILTLEGLSNIDVFNFNIKNSSTCRINGRQLRTGNTGTITVENGGVLEANATNSILAEWGGTSNVTINSGGLLRVTSGSNLDITTDNLTNNASEGILIEANSLTSYGALRFTSSYSGTGTVTQQRYLRSGTGNAGWNAISASMNASTASHFGTIGTDVHVNTKNLYRWDGSEWVNITNGSSTITPGIGYYGFVGTNGIQTTGDVYNFTGTPNTSITAPSLTFDNPGSGVTFTISGSTSNQGWNLIGNPFTCPLDFNTFTRTNVDDAFYIFTGTGYHSYAGGGLPNLLIGPMQAFWVKANAASPSLGTSWSMSSNGSVHSNPDLHRGTSIEDFFVLDVEDANDSEKTDRLTISIHNSATDDFDNEWDAWKLRNSAGYPNIYTKYNNNAMAINAVPYASGLKTFDVGFISTLHNHPYTIHLRDQYLTNGYGVYLEDKKLNLTHDFKNGAYTFINDTIFKDRFILKFSAIDPLSTNQAEVPKASPYQAWVHDGQIHLKGFENLGRTTLKVTDMTGKVIKVWNVDIAEGATTTFALPNLAKGVYVLNIVAGNNSKNIKFIY
ncbi:hypothetical protein JCM31826_08790 [Thermaurantimonas aggregans]|uniref:Secretion system C-terminal sorting domain-containing protein n=1 Tax=Thermaurantimonas aggregans TaxID=2173829 RepID=A0A401XK30_9FLAO|nr:T9SS type A sorting domain-containing protein [Thermaurantimonas aggregans]GCD77397.1 hypothetical protein JCM31826_08790 [Thermaurantimonas aggregans]